MSLDTKATEMTQRLEMLAVKIGEVFLDVKSDPGTRISLHGYEPEILFFIKEKLENYFRNASENTKMALKYRERAKKVEVQVGRGDYPVDVGDLISRMLGR